MTFKIVPAFFLMLLVSSCTPTNSPTVRTDKPANSSDLILEVNDAPYVFSMYPVYEKAASSQLRLSIEKEKVFQTGATVTADLVADDGHNSHVSFKENIELQRYVATVQLKHDEDYLIKTNIKLVDGNSSLTKTPTFAFHCGDPIPEVFNVEDIGNKQGLKSK